MIRLGVIQPVREDQDIFARIATFGLTACQLVSWNMGHCHRNLAAQLRRQAQEHNIEITAFWAGLPGPAVWNFIEGPATLGLVPEAYRRERINALKEWAEFAVELGTDTIVTHCGFIPENMNDPLYNGVLDAIGEVADHCASLGIHFLFETGQETPVVLLRTIETLNRPNLGINLDPANLILYGKGNPVDALDVF
ncbi:MAG: sugar phosphate isomerase/epimerase, partial [Lentisphaerae bacterium]